MESQPELDVAIVGGGISGIYTAWRILKAQSESKLCDPLAEWVSQRDGGLKVGVFESSNRIGGRLLSARSEAMPDTTCELGGMRYLSSQNRVVNLVETELDLEWEPQIVNPSRGSNICFVRNSRLRTDQLKDPCALPYQLESYEQPSKDRGTFSIVEQALQKALPGFLEQAKRGRGHLYEWLQGQSVDGLGLFNWGFWNLLLSRISGEGYEAAIDTIGYDVLGASYNSVDMISEIFDFADGVEYRKIKGGYERLPWRLKQDFLALGGRIEHKAWLGGFEYDDSSGAFLLKLLEGKGQVTSRALVLALPRRALERLFCDSLTLQRIDEGYINAVAPIRLFKLFLIYETPWWEDACVGEGRSLTDLPIRQCYYWEVAKESAGKERGPAALMVYNDVLNTDYWRSLTSEAIPAEPSLAPMYSGIHPTERQRRKISQQFADPPAFFEPAKTDVRLSPKQPSSEFHQRLLDNWRDSKAGTLVVDEAERLLLRLHGIERPSRLIDAAYADWQDAVHFWNVGYRSWELYENLIQPDKEVHCYICGEAYSTYQTWVEGALQTSDSVLSRLGARRP